MELSFLCAPSTHLNRDGLCQPACWHACRQSIGQALTDCPKFYEKTGFSAWGRFSCAAGSGWDGGGCWGCPPGLCAERALLLLFTLKLLLRDTLMKYKCETRFTLAEPGDEQRV